MTCEQYERQLALAIEGDLPERKAAPLEHHLLRCARCQEFLQGLEDSQKELKALAAEPIEDAVLATVRTRVLAVASEPAGPRRGVPAWGWGLAASLAVLALGLGFVRQPNSTRPRRTGGLVAASPAARGGPVPAPLPLETPAVTPARSSPERATAPLPPPRPPEAPPTPRVRQGQGPETARVVPELSPEDSDRLARAVVAVSRIRRLWDPPPAEPAEPFAPATVRLETPDPGVVIYWQLDPSGG